MGKFLFIIVYVVFALSLHGSKKVSNICSGRLLCGNFVHLCISCIDHIDEKGLYHWKMQVKMATL